MYSGFFYWEEVDVILRIPNKVIQLLVEKITCQTEIIIQRRVFDLFLKHVQHKRNFFLKIACSLCESYNNCRKKQKALNVVRISCLITQMEQMHQNNREEL